jgi:hypothetical protein
MKFMAFIIAGCLGMASCAVDKKLLLSASEAKIYSNIPLVVAILNYHFTHADKLDEREYYGLAFPAEVVEKLRAEPGLIFKKALAKSDLRADRRGVYHSRKHGRSLRVISMSSSQKASGTGEVVIYLNDYTAPHGSTSWTYKLRRDSNGKWKVAEHQLDTVS